MADRSLSRLCFLMRKFLKNERRDCDRGVRLLERPQAPIKIHWTRLKNRKIRGLRARPTLRSNLPGERAVNREARLGDRKLVFCFSKIYALKTQPTK